ncbi:MAG: methyltetrahydrofolate cobalamin methyltransferase [Clostridia bacterium]|nr:methyltetrahydrofolate cobalamin methyltransferase [Clostridia bacterium]
MIVIGERINSSRTPILQALRNRDSTFLQGEAQKQADAGAQLIDVNAAATLEDEPDSLAWLVEIVQQVVDKPLCLDSPNPEALTRALRVHRGKAMINSITGEKDRFSAILPLVLEYGASVIALCMDDQGLPETPAQRIRIATSLLEKLTEAGVPKEDIYFDPLVKPVSAVYTAGLDVLETVRILKTELGAQTVCGLSNISYGLPNRHTVNRAFTLMVMAAGMDAVLIDPLDPGLMSLIRAGRVILGQDPYASDYIRAFREGQLV